jgi:ribokinase
VDLSPILIVGSANADHVFRTPRMPSPGETVLGSSFGIYAGGKGANQAVAAALLGGAVSFTGCIGDDADGQLLIGSLRSANVDLRFLRVQAVPTGAAGIFVDDQGANVIVAAPGANSRVSADQVIEAADAVRPEFTLCQLEIPSEAVEACSRAGKFVLNPAPARPVSGELLARCFAITPNETELEFLTSIFPSDEQACAKAAHKLLDLGVENVIVTLGARGSQWISRSGSRLFSAPEVTPIDTTGAGDVFNGALVTLLAEGRDLANCLSLANHAAALSTTRLGAQSSAPSRAELIALARTLF